MIVVAVVMLLFFPMAIKRATATGWSREGAAIAWLLATIVASALGYAVFGRI